MKIGVCSSFLGPILVCALFVLSGCDPYSAKGRFFYNASVDFHPVAAGYWRRCDNLSGKISCSIIRVVHLAGNETVFEFSSGGSGRFFARNISNGVFALEFDVSSNDSIESAYVIGWVVGKNDISLDSNICQRLSAQNLAELSDTSGLIMDGCEVLRPDTQTLHRLLVRAVSATSPKLADVFLRRVDEAEGRAAFKVKVDEGRAKDLSVTSSAKAGLVSPVKKACDMASGRYILDWGPNFPDWVVIRCELSGGERNVELLIRETTSQRRGALKLEAIGAGYFQGIFVTEVSAGSESVYSGEVSLRFRDNGTATGSWRMPPFVLNIGPSGPLSLKPPQ